jgi:hypothetical protein
MVDAFPPGERFKVLRSICGLYVFHLTPDGNVNVPYPIPIFDPDYFLLDGWVARPGNSFEIYREHDDLIVVEVHGPEKYPVVGGFCKQVLGIGRGKRLAEAIEEAFRLSIAH